MLSLALLIMNQAIVTATIASSNRPTLPIVSATISIRATGAREIRPKTAIMPTTTKRTGPWPVSERSSAALQGR